MFVPVYLEIDNDKNPIFKDAFLKDVEKKIEKRRIIVSKEYADCIDANSEDVVVIPTELLDKVDVLNVQVANRAVSLELQKNKELSAWIKTAINSVGDDVEGFIINGLYDFVCEAAYELDVKVVFSAENLCNEKERLNSYMETLENRDAKLLEYEARIQEMQSQIDSKNESMQRLQQKITDLSAELFKNNAEKEYMDEQLEANEQKMDKSERQKVLLADLYAAVLKELSDTKTELLNIKSRGV